jgi:hypothetical protein
MSGTAVSHQAGRSHEGAVPFRRIVWYTGRSCAGPVARRMLAFGAVEARA